MPWDGSSAVGLGGCSGCWVNAITCVSSRLRDSPGEVVMVVDTGMDIVFPGVSRSHPLLVFRGGKMRREVDVALALLFFKDFEGHQQVLAVLSVIQVRACCILPSYLQFPIFMSWRRRCGTSPAPDYLLRSSFLLRPLPRLLSSSCGVHSRYLKNRAGFHTSAVKF